MLGASCPDCFVPLMRSRDREVLCLSCNSEFIQQEDNFYVVAHLPPSSQLEEKSRARARTPIRREA